MGAKIFILDPVQADRRSLETMLAAHGYQVACPELDAGLLDELKAAEADCIFADYSIAQGEDYGLLGQLRRDPELETVPVILTTAFDCTESQIHAFRAGANLCLKKPLVEEEVLVKLDEQLRMWRLRAELRQQFELNQALLMRLQDDLALGQQVQKSFLPPRQMRTSNFDLEARLIPSGDLSGDYFDYRLITPERLVVFLADVSGHGVASALLAGRLKAFFDENFRRSHRPRLFMEQLNKVMIDLGEHYHIATAVCVHVDVVDTNIVYASAGHRTLYWLDNEDGQHTRLPATGPALGMFEEFDITEVNHGFLPGRNRLVSYTDGLIEFKSSDGSWSSEDSFRDSYLLPFAKQSLQQYVDALLESSRALTARGAWDDDVSLIVADF